MGNTNAICQALTMVKEAAMASTNLTMEQKQVFEYYINYLMAEKHCSGRRQ